MFINEVINPAYIPLSAADTVEDGLDAAVKQNADILALIDFTTGRVLGTVTREKLSSEKDRKGSLLALARRKPLILRSGLHVADALREMEAAGEQAAIVVDENKHFAGVVFRGQMQQALSGLLNSGRHGAVVMVEMMASDYSLTEIIRIVENQGVKVLSVGVETPSSGENRFRVSLKLNTDDIDQVLHVLNRYGYVITSKTENETSDQELHDRADEFMRFLNI